MHWTIKTTGFGMVANSHSYIERKKSREGKEFGNLSDPNQISYNYARMCLSTNPLQLDRGQL